MANNLKLSDAAANAEANALAALLNSGHLKIYNSTQPATADASITTQVMLCDLIFGNPAFGAASGGIIVANAITPDSSAAFSSTATWFRCTTAGGASVKDGTCGVSGCDLNLNSVAISAGAQVSVTSLQHTVTKG